jgi:hypothetical protein
MILNRREMCLLLPVILPIASQSAGSQESSLNSGISPRPAASTHRQQQCPDPNDHAGKAGDRRGNRSS